MAHKSNPYKKARSKFRWKWKKKRTRRLQKKRRKMRQRSNLFGPGFVRHGAQVQPLQEGSVQVPLEVEEEAHPPIAEEAPQDAPALQVRHWTSLPLRWNKAASDHGCCEEY
ncbi:unnamed protein product [Polarella glacialis]|uniref:60S ribosomal protein L41 n=1 Tax=Polarella glacialis TaxID=89957 RepID=A0A813GKK3_POLGL|nr:unnamed protein product [Polarella glacialis]